MRVTEIDGEKHLAGNDVAAVRLVLDEADGANRVGRMIARDRVDALDHAGGAKERILAQPHRRRAGMRLLAGDRDLVPAHALHALDDADHAAFVFEDRALLDVQLEHGAEFAHAGFLAALVADAAEFFAEALAVAIFTRIGEFGREHSGENARRQHRRRVARAFLVGPVDDLDRRVGLVAGFVQRAHRLQRAEDAERTVKFAAGRLGVEMRAHGNRREIVVLAGAACEHVADFVNRDRAAERLAARLEPVTYLPVEVGQREAANAALRRCADLRRLHQRVPEPLRIDLKVLHGRKLQPGG